METATLTSPPRPIMVQPVQKSMSLPSYARASGEGIDHKLIFAALEQREKIRQKNKIFKDKEKKGTSRQSYFCLPLSSNAKCKETSLSSDTSCSSLEFQKPNSRNSPKLDKKAEKPLENGVNVTASAPKPAEQPAKQTAKCDDDAYGRIKVSPKSSSPSHTQSFRKVSTHSPKEPAPRLESNRNTIGSSDSMERTDKSSRSSNDSLTRKERLEAIKARVEAERQRKLGYSSSEEEEETSLKITRHNSDGVIIRTVREVKTKSSRPERRYRRKQHEESLARRAARKKHTSLYLPSTTDFESWKPPVVRSGSSLSLHGNLEDVTKDFLSTETKPSSPSFYHSSFPQSATRDSYHSDICSGSYRSRFARPRLQDIETKEYMPRVGCEKPNLLSSENSVLLRKSCRKTEEPKTGSLKTSCFAIGSKYSVDREHLSESLPNKKGTSSNSRAPTPPPRSPKSIEFVNKAIIHHQNMASSFHTESYSLERKKSLYLPRISRPESSDYLSDAIIKDLISTRRRTCTNFSVVEDQAFERSKTPTYSHQSKTSSHNFPPRSPDLSQKLSPASRRSKGLVPSPETNVRKLLTSAETQAKKWEQIELDSEKKFNSFDYAKFSSWSKWKCLPRKKRSCASCSTAAGNAGEVRCDCAKDQKAQLSNPLQDIIDDREGNKQTCRTTEPVSKLFTRFSASSPPAGLQDSAAKGSSLKCQKEKAGNAFEEQNGSKTPSVESEYMTRQDATENLNSAMQELEDVYRSLRISSENLSEHQGSDDYKLNKRLEASRNSRPEEGSRRFRSLSVTTPPDRARLRSPLKFLNNGHTSETISGKKADQSKHSVGPISHSASSDHVPPAESLCIEELFSDLTQQLDLEQKLLEESRAKKMSSSPVPKQMSKTDVSQNHSEMIPATTSTKPPPSELTTTTTTITTEDKSSEKLTVANVEQRILARRKHKAVRSLSANLATLMANSPINQERSVNLGGENSKVLPPDVETLSNGPSESRRNESKSATGKSEGLKPLSLEQPKEEDEGKSSASLVNVPFETTNPKGNKPDEIWQIRVSMGSGESPVKSPLPTKDYHSSAGLRLHTALQRPKIGNSCGDGRSPTDKDGDAPFVNQPIHGKTATSAAPINETELEKLLTNLLSDVNKGTLPEISSPSPTPKNSKDGKLNDLTKGDNRYVTIKSMESDVGANSRTKNGKNDGDEILHETPPHSLDQKLDNDSHRNNNESGTVIGSSFIPVRNKSNLPQSRLVQRYRMPDDNRTASSQCSSLAIETVSYPHSSPSRNYPRRHSVCVDGLSEVCSCHGHKNCNQDSRFQVVQYRAASPSLHAVSNNQGAPSEAGDNSLGQGEVRNGNDNIKFEKRSSCNGSEQAFSPEIHASVPPAQRLKDKSFIRKSTLNRIEFVQPAHQALGYISNSGQNYHYEQHSTSEANSDKSPVEDTVPAAVKRKGGFHHPGRGSFESQWKTDFQHGTKTSLSTRAMPSFGSRPHVEQLKARNRRGARVCISSFEKSFSAGEHDVHTDPSDCSRKTKVCFSAQETCHAESKPSYRQVMPSETKACVPSNHMQNVPKRHSSLEDVLTVSANGHGTNSETAPHACDNSSQIVAKDDSSGGASVGGKGFVFSNKGNGDGGEGVGEDNAANEMQRNGSPTQQNEQVTIESCSAAQSSPCVKLDQDLFACRSSPVPASCSHFPVVSDENTDLKLSECTAVVSEEVKSADFSSSFNACSEEVVDVMKEVSCLEISPEPVEPSIAKSSLNSLESEKESTRQISSILRRKSGDEKREIHGILKNTSEDRAPAMKHRPSILKHRESSEEKDSWSQSDLHSILKKSSEDESSSNSPDIRPILKNTSTDDESSGLTSKPKPILKKRTSFNEDCSYACFHSGELKPILKKKTISEMSEEQPKPILKTRRKSEESASIMNEFSVGARPRAYSADRGVRIALEKKLNDDDFT